jgi:UDP-N-acetylmuramoyl-tripeptide--D-alanyl-D-alanine ligase
MVRVRGEGFALSLETPARHELTNAAGALAVALAAGVDIDEAVAALKLYRPIAMRTELLTTATGATVISDCYNAAPSSMKAALQTLQLMAGSARKVAFLGDMGELGDDAPAMHKDVVEYAASSGLDELVAVGPTFTAAAPHASQSFETSQKAAGFARDGLKLNKGDVVLVKGSRSMAMELIVEALTGQRGTH